MIRIVRGKVHGKIIELEEELGVAEGQKVEVQVTIMETPKNLPGPPPGWQPGGTSRTAGLLEDSWTTEDDRILEDIHTIRKQETQREIVE